MVEAVMLLVGLGMGAVLHAIWGRPACRYGRWLGRTCWVRPVSRGAWREHVVIAASWRGGVCVRSADGREDGYWIRKENVPWRVTFQRPEEVDG